MKTIEINIPYQDAHWLDIIHQQGKVIKEKYSSKNISVRANIAGKLAQKLEAQFSKS